MYGISKERKKVKSSATVFEEREKGTRSAEWRAND